MTDAQQGTRASRVAATREAILTSAEQLFGEYGIAHVSSRQVGEAAGQGNTAAVGYHFGGKAELIRAILARHQHAINALRLAELERVGESADIRAWIACFVRPTTTHLESLGSPTWYGRFSAQVATDPAWAEIAMDEARDTPGLMHITRGIQKCVPDLSARVCAERMTMGRILLTQVIAEHERALERGGTCIWENWAAVADSLVDVVSSLWLAPVGAGHHGSDAESTAR
ncbi:MULTISPECIES: helix-turn-helix domain-containing protein [unclassified Curtobacterium]|uniref:TetR/AcrR family transcriptional regulator n=1 Tax=unclassified Curtobacterium TaxID=257496 RepID=UPI000D8FFEE2|nr:MULTISPECIES: helix-turn-helix domain-containing protein [unclassified Curtobacterium]PYY65725.1 TetR family transcriptional regulator [Curtobacterium sp. MCPF17_003]PZE73107.1 TetR family transcriptional regulator [Curtobacterium sp. MCPF17_018]WIB71197.1 helix-turn-helix domain-containing protein [Curtobacterium sp. MCBD17_026]